MIMYLVGAYFDSICYMKMYYADDPESYEDRRLPFELQTFNLTVWFLPLEAERILIGTPSHTTLVLYRVLATGLI